MTLAQRYTESDTPLIGKQSVAAAHLQATAYAADLPFGNGPYKSQGGRRGRGAENLDFRCFGPWAAPQDPGRAKTVRFKPVSFILT